MSSNQRTTRHSVSDWINSHGYSSNNQRPSNGKTLSQNLTSGLLLEDTEEHEPSISDIASDDRRTVYNVPKHPILSEYVDEMSTDNHAPTQPTAGALYPMDSWQEQNVLADFPPNCREQILAWRKQNGSERPSFVLNTAFDLDKTDTRSKAYWIRRNPFSGQLEGISVRFVRWPEAKKDTSERELQVTLGRAAGGDEFIVGRNSCTANGDKEDKSMSTSGRTTRSEWAGVGTDEFDTNLQGYRRPLNTIENRYDYNLKGFQPALERESRNLEHQISIQVQSIPPRRQTLVIRKPSANPSKKRPSSSNNSSTEKRRKQAEVAYETAESTSQAGPSLLPSNSRSSTHRPSAEIPNLLAYISTLPAMSTQPATLSDAVASTNVENTLDPQLLDEHMKTHLSLLLRVGSEPSDSQTSIKVFPFNDDDAKSMADLRETTQRAGLFWIEHKDHGQMLSLKIPGVAQPVIIEMSEKEGKEFVKFRKALRGTSSWKTGEQGITGDYVVEAIELKMTWRPLRSEG